jgi:hypothetical protein
MSSESHEVPFPATDAGNWRLQHVEQLLSALDGVNSVKIVTDDQGTIQEIHVLSGSDIGAKQIVRNVESALLAELGLQVDHRKISVARMREGDLDDIRDSHEELGVSNGRRLILESVQIERRAGRTASCRVDLSNGERTFRGESEGSDSTRTRCELAAEAVLDALRSATEDDAPPIVLEGVETFDTLGRTVALAVVRARSGRSPVPLSGSSIVVDSPEEAAVLAVLQATNRWIAESLRLPEGDESDE